MNKKIFIICGCVVTLAATIGLYYPLFAVHSNPSEQLKHGFYMAEQAKPIDGFELIESPNKPFITDQFSDQWSLVFFGFTHCPDVCPTELLFLKQVYESLDSDLKPQVYLIALDPIRDTPEAVANYVTFFHPSFKGLTGSQQTINQLIKPFGAYYEFVEQALTTEPVLLPNTTPPEQLSDSFTINHTAWIYLINPDGNIHAGFSSPVKLADMVSDISYLIESY